LKEKVKKAYMKKILITGLSGFIGGYLKNRLAPKYQIFDLGCDLLDKEGIDKRLQEVDPDFIIHLAARTEVEMSFYEQTTFSSINYVGTVNMVESARHLKNLKLFVFSSTMETYGWQPESDLIRDKKDFTLPVFTEETRQHPNAPYAVAKVGCELYLEYAKRSFNFPFCAFRQTNTYGRKDNDFFVVEQIITQMLKNPNEINLGYGEPYRNFLWIDDLINLYETVVENPEKAQGEVFCTGPNNALSIKELVNKIAKKIGWSGQVNWDTKPKRDGEIWVLNSSPAKAERLLGWSPKMDLDTGLDLTIQIWRELLAKKD
jgi:nucleoside-diphosphate-sugar epimerase